MSLPRVRRTVAVMPPSSRIFWNCATAARELGFRGLSSTWFRGNYYMLLQDLPSFIKAQDRVEALYRDPKCVLFPMRERNAHEVLYVRDL